MKDQGLADPERLIEIRDHKTQALLRTHARILEMQTSAQLTLRHARELLLPLREEARRHNAVTRGAALALAATGLPRMTARVFVCLLIADGGGLTAAPFRALAARAVAIMCARSIAGLLRNSE